MNERSNGISCQARAFLLCYGYAEYLRQVGLVPEMALTETCVKCAPLNALVATALFGPSAVRALSLDTTDTSTLWGCLLGTLFISALLCGAWIALRSHIQPERTLYCILYERLAVGTRRDDLPTGRFLRASFAMNAACFVAAVAFGSLLLYGDYNKSTLLAVLDRAVIRIILCAWLVTVTVALARLLAGFIAYRCRTQRDDQSTEKTGGEA